MLSTCTKKKAGLVGCYLNVQRKKLDLLDVIYVVGCYNLHVQRKKLDLDVIYITKEKAGIVQVL